MTLLDAISLFVIAVAAISMLGTGWLWKLYLGPDNPSPRSKLLLVLAIKSTFMSLACVMIAVLAVVRLGGFSLGETGGLLLVAAIVLLELGHGVLIVYLFLLRRLRQLQTGTAMPPPFVPGD